VDVTGAGNAYCGGFLVGLAETGDLGQAGRYGAVSASFALEQFGAVFPLEGLRARAEQRLEALGVAWRAIIPPPPRGGHAMHEYIPELEVQYRRGEITRREFVRSATLLGLSLTAASTFVGRPLGPAIRTAHAQAKRGGVLRYATRVQKMK